MKLRSALPLGILALTALALASQGIVLKRTPKVGEKKNYKVTGNFDFQTIPIALKGTSTEEVLKVENDTVTTKSAAKVSIDAGGQTQDMEDAAETIVTKLDGTVLEVKSGTATSTPALRLANMNMLFLPATPVETNGSWVAEAKKDDKKGTPGYKINYKLVGEEKVGDWDTYKITSEGGETTGDAPTKVKATYWIDKTNGGLVRSLAELTDAVFQEGLPSLSGKMDIVLQP